MVQIGLCTTRHPAVAPCKGREARCPPRAQKPARQSSWRVGKEASERASGWGVGCGPGRGCIRCRQGSPAESQVIDVLGVKAGLG